MFVEDGEFREEFSVEGFYGIGCEIGVAAGEICEDSIGVLGVYFSKECFATRYFCLVITIRSVVVSPASDRVHIRKSTFVVLFLRRWQTRR
jgi:hypothetical protein